MKVNSVSGPRHVLPVVLAPKSLLLAPVETVMHRGGELFTRKRLLQVLSGSKNFRSRTAQTTGFDKKQNWYTAGFPFLFQRLNQLARVEFPAVKIADHEVGLVTTYRFECTASVRRMDCLVSSPGERL